MAIADLIFFFHSPKACPRTGRFEGSEAFPPDSLRL
jgi:hypothetical protein